MKPVIFLDVDGVLNRFGLQHKINRHDGHPLIYSDFELHERVAPLDGPWAFDLRLSKEMVADIAAMPADVYWLTTWTRSAPAVVAPLCGAPEWPYVDWYTTKYDGLAETLNELGSRPFIWIDDEEATRRNVERVERQLDFDLPTHLLVQPHPYRGILRDQMDAIRIFCKSEAVK